MIAPTPIASLPDAGALAGTDAIPIGRALAAEKTTLAAVAAYVAAHSQSNGQPGVDGRTIRYGDTAPDAAYGYDGDFFINRTTWHIYGPRAAGAWPAGVSLLGGTTPLDDAIADTAPGSNLVTRSAQKIAALIAAAVGGKANQADLDALTLQVQADTSIDDSIDPASPGANVVTRSAQKIAALVAAAVATKTYVDDATADTAPTAGLFTRSASKIAALIAAAVSTTTRVAADRTALAATAVKSLPTYMPEGRASSWWDFYTNAAYAAEYGNTAAGDAAIDTRKGVLVASTDATGVWVRRHGGRVTPYHFGAVGKIEGQTSGWVDDAPALNAWAAWIVSRANRRVIGEANGKFVINSQVTFGSRTASTRGVQIIGSWELFANAVMDRMLETGRIEFFQITGQLHLFGAGPNTEGGDVTWVNRLAKIGWYNFGCNRMNVDVFRARFFQLAGYFTSGSTGSEANDSCRFGIIRPHFCGSGVIGADSLQANYSAPVNNGAANSATQTTTLTVDAIPPTYLTDITGGNSALNGGQVLPIGAFVNGRVYQVTVVDATHITLYPWIDANAPSTGTLSYIFGAGVLDRGSDANVYEIGLIDGQFCGVIFWDLAIYGAHINQVQAASSGVGYMVGGGRANSSIGGGVESFYPEGNTADIVVFDNFLTGVAWKNGNFGMYEGNLSKCYVALVPRAADNSLDATQSMFAQLPMQYNGTRLAPQGHPGGNLFYGKAAVDWTLCSVPQVFAGMGATSVTIHPPLTNSPGGVRPNDDWTQLPDLNRLYGHDSSVCLFMGAAASGTPGGAITFQASMQYRAAVVTNGNAVITGLASTTGLVAGMPAQPSGSAATTILSVDSPTQITLAAAPTATTTLIKLPGASVNGAASAVFNSFAGAAVFAAYYRFATNDIVIRQVAGGTVFTGDSGTGGTKGLVPAPAAGDAAAGKYLDAAGGFSVPGAAAGSTPTVSVVAQGKGSAPITGTTAETTVATVNLPALGPNDQIYVRTLWQHSGAGGTWTPRVRLGGGAGTLVLGGTALAAANVSTHMESRISNQVATNSQAFYNPGSNPDLGVSSVGVQTAAIETNAGTTLVISGQLTVGTDTMTLFDYQVIVYRG